MREALWIAAACCRFHSGQPAAVEPRTVPGKARLRASSRDQSGSKLPQSKAGCARNASATLHPARDFIHPIRDCPGKG
jgi:hypothetical protein